MLCCCQRVSLPIYEYYCDACRGRFSHLARRFDEPSPPCPRCGNVSVERLISASNVIRSAAHHEQQLKDDASRVTTQDAQAAAQFLDDSGRLVDTGGLYGSRAYRELIARRKDGATDADVADLVDDLTAAADLTPAAELAGMVALFDQVDNRIGAEGPPEGHEHGQGLVGAPDEPHDSEQRRTRRPQSRRSARNLGWG